MNLHITGVIIRREYLNKVKKKSFLITTFVVPVLFAAICLLPSLIMFATKEEAKKVAVVDASGIVATTLDNSATLSFVNCDSLGAEYVKSNLETLCLDAVLVVSGLNEETRSVDADIYSLKPLGVEMAENIGNRINKAVEAYRVESYGIEGLETIMRDVKSDVKLHSYTLDEEGRENVSESEVYMVVSMLLGIIIYMFIALFGGMVMSSVIEEKSSRVVEVLVSSVKATELMFGKIIGIALVALTQFLLWIVLTVAIVGVVGAVSGERLTAGADPTELVQQMGVSASQAETITAAAEPGEMSVILSTLGNLPVGRILVCFLIYFLCGYVLYASLYAAIGSAVDNEGDTQQLQMPVTIPLLIGFFIAFYTFKAPESAVSFWGSLIPFTSPIVMLARLPFGVPVWEVAVSVALLLVTTVVFAWLSAKIYKVGILMFGKKSTWKDLWKWLKQN
ncbi:MAG: ABC transporter permease [Bacteroidales bacterium]|nr:ABC transporter permease [Bacteroidales bacterium]